MITQVFKTKSVRFPCALTEGGMSGGVTGTMSGRVSQLRPLLAASHFHWDFCRLHRKEETHHQLCCHRATSFRKNSVLDYLSSTLQNFSSPPLTKGTTIATSILQRVWKSWKTKPSKDAWKKGLTRGTCSIPMWPQQLEQRLWRWWLQPWKASE